MEKKNFSFFLLFEEIDTSRVKFDSVVAWTSLVADPRLS